jgi:hypothetical protein
MTQFNFSINMVNSNFCFNEYFLPRLQLRNYKISYTSNGISSEEKNKYSFIKLFDEHKIGHRFFNREFLDKFDPLIQTYRPVRGDYYPAIEVSIDMFNLMEIHRIYSMPKFIFDQWEELFNKSETDPFVYEQLDRHLIVFFLKISRRERHVPFGPMPYAEPEEVWPEFLRGDQFENFYNKVIKEHKQYYTDPFQMEDAFNKYGPFESKYTTLHINLRRSQTFKYMRALNRPEEEVKGVHEMYRELSNIIDHVHLAEEREREEHIRPSWADEMVGHRNYYDNLLKIMEESYSSAYWSRFLN